MSWQSLNKAPPSSHLNSPVRREHDSDPDPPPPPYSASLGDLFADPRSSSQQSLVPSDADHHGKRTLLVIYIHGFNGNSQSFRSFPAHVHAYLKEALKESHVVHTKLYPRYKTYKAVEVARDRFSQWLLPHEGPDTDVILVGHSMGGILAADVILMPNHDPTRQQPFKHRILGHVSLDCPFLGLHPGIVVSGIASLFQPAPKRPEDPTYVQPLDGQSTSSPGLASPASETPLSPVSSTASTGPSQATIASGHRPDPTFNPPFWNDETYEERPFFQSVFSFLKKHRADGIADSVYKRLTDQLEFGGCLANYPSLQQRYKRIRALEDVDEIAAVHTGHPPGSHAKVRFVNYYTLSSNPPKKPKKPKEAERAKRETQQAQQTQQAKSGDELTIESKTSPDSSRKSSIPITVTKPEGNQASSDCPSSSLQDHDKAPRLTDAPPDQTVDNTTSRLSQLSMQQLDPEPMSDSDVPESDPSTGAMEPEGPPHPTEPSSPDRILSMCPSQDETDLPPLPSTPEPPVLPDLEVFTDKLARKQAEKESKRLQKVYQQSLKDRAKAVKEREKLVEKRQKALAKAEDREKREGKKLEERSKKADAKEKRTEESHEKKEKQRLEKEKRRMDREAEKLRKGKYSSTSIPAPPTDSDPETSVPSTANLQTIVKEADSIQGPPAKPKKFCTTPSAGDETWVPVHMRGMNEITAHCGLFFAGEHYEKLVGDVGGLVTEWVEQDMTVRTVLGMDVD